MRLALQSKGRKINEVVEELSWFSPRFAKLTIVEINSLRTALVAELVHRGH